MAEIRDDVTASIQQVIRLLVFDAFQRFPPVIEYTAIRVDLVDCTCEIVEEDQRAIVQRSVEPVDSDFNLFDNRSAN